MKIILLGRNKKIHLSAIMIILIMLCLAYALLHSFFQHQYLNTTLAFVFLFIALLALFAHIYFLRYLRRDKNKIILLYLSFMTILVSFSSVLLATDILPFLDISRWTISILFFSQVFFAQALLLFIAISRSIKKLLHVRSLFSIMFLIALVIFRLQVPTSQIIPFVASPFYLYVSQPPSIYILMFTMCVLETLISIVLLFQKKQENKRFHISVLCLNIGFYLLVFHVLSPLSLLSLPFLAVGNILFLRSFLYHI